MAYSNAAVFASEVIATTFTIYLGESILANELLSGTKGRAMGWGFVALGFGAAFGFGVMILSYISAHLNPAVCLALWILGKIPAAEFGAAMAGEFVGAFIGAVLVWIHYLPHFKTVPTPAKSPEDLLLKGIDALTPTALNIGSYNVRQEDVAARARGLGELGNTLEEIKFYLKDSYKDSEPVEKHAALVEVALGPNEVNGGAERLANRLRRRSVQVCDVHRRLKDIDMEEFKAMFLTPDRTHRSMPSMHRNSASAIASTDGSSNDASSAPIGASRSTGALPMEENEKVNPTLAKKQEHLDKLYDAAVVADKNIKLSIFATRPAIYSPFFNFITEFMSTTALVYGALMIFARRELLYGPERALWRAEEGLMITFFVFLAVLALGGPTGIAANPARDFSPRLAHFLLPIPGKGPSEWYYSWIPFVAPFVGGCAAAGLYAATQLLNDSQVDPTVSFPGSAA